jgi:hypothetical protein
MGIQGQVIGGSGRRTRRLLLAGSRLPAGAALAALVLPGASAPAAAQALTWSLVPSPSPGTAINGLDGVSCISATACTACASATACTAAGYHIISSGGIRTMIESGTASGF